MRTAVLRTPREASSSSAVTERARPPAGPSVGSGSASVEARPGTHGVPDTVTIGRSLPMSSSPRQRWRRLPRQRPLSHQGYDATTVAQIAERAGVTRSTFFRHFPGKRELLVARQETLSRLLADGISEAPATASPLEAVAAGLERASSAMGPMNREPGPRLRAAVAAGTELQERDALKNVGRTRSRER